MMVNTDAIERALDLKSGRTSLLGGVGTVQLCNMCEFEFLPEDLNDGRCGRCVSDCVAFVERLLNRGD